MTFLTASLALPTACWASPLPFCTAPLTSRLGLPTALPAARMARDYVAAYHLLLSANPGDIRCRTARGRDKPGAGALGACRAAKHCHVAE